MPKDLRAVLCAILFATLTGAQAFGQDLPVEQKLFSADFYDSLQVDFIPVATEEDSETSAEAEQVNFAQIGYGRAGGAKKKAGPSPAAKSHKGVFYANDFSYLSDPANQGIALGDALKQLPLDGGNRGTLDIGGQFRLRYHGETSFGREVGITPDERFNGSDTDFLLSRLRLYANWQASERVRFYVEGIHAEVTDDGGDYIPRGIDRNRGDFLNAFVDVQVTENSKVRFGRQELLFGSQRLVSPLDWGNTRRRFEGARWLYNNGPWASDTFWTAFVPVDFDDFDEADYNQRLYGNYTTYQGFENFGVDFYYLGFENQNLVPGGDLSLHTLGLRINGGIDDWLFEFEGAPQFGRQSGLGQDHSAGFATVGIGRKAKRLPGGATLWFYYDYASGGVEPTDDFNQNNQLFPLAHKYLGFVDAVQRSNIESPNVLLALKPGPKWNLLLWYYHFIANDGAAPVPAVGGNTATANNASTDVGDELDILLKYTFCSRSNLVLGWSRFFRGNRFNNPATQVEDSQLVYGQYTLNF